MTTLNFELRKILSACICSLLLAWTSCSDEAVISGPAEGEIPITIQAEISAPESTTRTETAEDATNDYDRSSFMTGDVIRVTRTTSANTSTYAKYQLAEGGKWEPLGTPISLRIGATYQATFPENYSSIANDQSTQAKYLASNLLKTPDLASSTGELNFTGENAFVHQNTKITLVFSGAAGATSLSGNFSNFTISGNGLYSGGNTEETMYFYRPNNNVSTWCGIVYPKNAIEVNPASTEISLSLTYDQVNYKAKISCPMVAGKHYKYKLTIQNDILVPEGMAIDGWISTDAPGNPEFGNSPTT